MNKSVNQLKSELKSVIAGYLDLLVQRPAMEAVENDFELQDKLSDILILLKLVQQQVISFDPRRLDDVLVKAFEPVKPISEDTLSLNELFRLLPTQTRAKLEARTIYLSYLDQLFNWTVVSILSASYLSAFVLLRTLLELLVNASSEDTGGLRKRVAGVPFLEAEERKEIVRNWDELCGWTHPYGRWFNEMCPVYVSLGPRYHSRLAGACLGKLQLCLDFALVIAINQFDMNPDGILKACQEMHASIDSFPMLRRRNNPPSIS